jgi:hypothetical protein
MSVGIVEKIGATMQSEWLHSFRCKMNDCIHSICKPSFTWTRRVVFFQFQVLSHWRCRSFAPFVVGTVFLLLPPSMYSCTATFIFVDPLRLWSYTSLRSPNLNPWNFFYLELESNRTLLDMIPVYCSGEDNRMVGGCLLLSFPVEQ